MSRLSGYKHTEESKKKISTSKKGEKNPMWKGNKVGRLPLHRWIERNKPKKELCENCNKVKPYDLANISGEYKRDINDFKWLCRACHMKEDGRLKILLKNGTKSRIRKKSGSLFWCIGCQILKEKKNFTKSKKSFDGLDHYCIECKSRFYRRRNAKM